MLITAGDGSRWIGTGWLISPRTLITAGHVVYIHSRGGWVRSIDVIAGRNGANRPFGTCRSTAFRSVLGWVSGRKRDYDYGAIILPGSCPVGSRVGWFGFAVGIHTNGSLSGNSATRINGPVFNNLTTWRQEGS